MHEVVCGEQPNKSNPMQPLRRAPLGHPTRACPLCGQSCLCYNLKPRHDMRHGSVDTLHKAVFCCATGMHMPNVLQAVQPPTCEFSAGNRVPEECPQGVVNLWRSCVARDPNARPSATAVQAMLEALLPIQRLQQAQPAPPAEAAAASASNASSATQPHTPPHTQKSTAARNRR